VLLAGVGSSGTLWRYVGGSPLLHMGSGGFAIALLLVGIVAAGAYLLLSVGPTSRGGWASLVLLLAVIAALLYALTRVQTPRPLPRPLANRRVHVKTVPPVHRQARARPFHLGHVGAWWWAIGLGAAALAVAAWELRRREAVVAPEPDGAEEVRAAVEISLAEIEQEPDPRRAVIKAYVRMESSLAASGLPRRAVETSLEYMTRVLGALRVTRPPVERLTTLFHEARYSRHAVGPSMKADAIAALVAIRDQLGMGA
jgi:Domain of unknown function (DUF4129)